MFVKKSTYNKLTKEKDVLQKKLDNLTIEYMTKILGLENYVALNENKQLKKVVSDKDLSNKTFFVANSSPEKRFLLEKDGLFKVVMSNDYPPPAYVTNFGDKWISKDKVLKYIKEKNYLVVRS